MTFLYTLNQSGIASMARRENFLDGGAPFYNTYKCADGKWVSVGPIEPHFYTVLLDKAQIADPDLQNPYDKARWPEQRQKLEAIFARKSRDEWCALLEGTDACFAPILDITEAPHHPHNIARGSYIEVDGLMQPGPAPKFSETPGAVQRGAPNVGEHTEAALREWGLSAGEVEALIKSGAA
jgi:alpha-methylacyl-CoA racemase